MNDLAKRYRRGSMAMLLAVLTILLTANPGGPAKAQDAWTKGPNTASSGDFAIVQIATTDSAALQAEWAKPTPGVKLQTSTQMTRNQAIETFIIFKGCGLDKAGNCNLTVQYEVFNPAGKSLIRVPGMIWVGLPPPPDLQLQLSASSLGLTLDDGDPLGPYRIQARVTDHVAKVTLQTEQVLTAVAN